MSIFPSTVQENTNGLQQKIEATWPNRAQFNPKNVPVATRQAVTEVLKRLDAGQLRVAEQDSSGQWVVRDWLKKAILLSFVIQPNRMMGEGSVSLRGYDKMSSKFSHYDPRDFDAAQIRVAPPAMVRHGAYIGKNVVLMPCFVNVGAYIDDGCMLDTWSTIGSCAQIGKNVHISGGAGIGGVLEPLQANPVIIEDHCFIGARSEVVEGVIIGAHSVIAMGVFISQSTKIYERATGKIFYGHVPPGSVVVPGTLPSADGSHSLDAAIIVKTVDAQTRAKVSPNELLRHID